MDSKKKMFLAVVLNAAFAVVELVGGLWTGSAAVLSDAVHDFGDALSMTLSYALERKSHRAPDGRYTFGYARFSLLGALITGTVLFVGSGVVISHAVQKLMDPTPVHYDGMIALGVIGVLVNGGAVLLTHKGDTLNQRAVSLHLFEDVCGWGVVLVGAAVMKRTACWWLDPLLSIGVSVVLAYQAINMLREVLAVLLECAPTETDTEAFCEELKAIEGVTAIGHVHVWSLDGERTLAELHVVSAWEDFPRIQEQVIAHAKSHGIHHITVQWDKAEEHEVCPLGEKPSAFHGHHHHHHHHHAHG